MQSINVKSSPPTATPSGTIEGHPERAGTHRQIARPLLHFEPPRLLRHGAVQTFLSQWKPTDSTAFLCEERPLLLDAGVDETGMDPAHPVRLLGYYNCSPHNRHDGSSKGLVLLLHGWEGCSHSTYNVVVASALLAQGYDVFRLNLRDHGPGLHADPHALNRGIFLGSLLREAATAAHKVAAMAGRRPFYIAGPSMGGNFALRLALWHAIDPFPNLRRVIAISPAINPDRATKLLDRKPLYQRYFHRRWTGSLRRKAALFPEIFDPDALDMRLSVYALTDRLIRRFGMYGSAEEYFRSYTLGGMDFAGLTVPTHVITAADDPVIPVVDFYAIAPHPLLDLRIFSTGGHVGFMSGPPVHHRLPEMLLDLLALDDPAAG